MPTRFSPRAPVIEHGGQVGQPRTPRWEELAEEPAQEELADVVDVAVEPDVSDVLETASVEAVSPQELAAREAAAAMDWSTPDSPRINRPAADDPANLVCDRCKKPYGMFRLDPFTGKMVHQYAQHCMQNPFV